MTTRRGFLGGLAGVLAAGFAPAAIGSGVLMPVRQVVTAPAIYMRPIVDWRLEGHAVDALRYAMQDWPAVGMVSQIRQQQEMINELVSHGVLMMEVGVDYAAAVDSVPWHRVVSARGVEQQ